LSWLLLLLWPAASILPVRSSAALLELPLPFLQPGCSPVSHPATAATTADGSSPPAAPAAAAGKASLPKPPPLLLLVLLLL
jgi:hypothetical protein